MEICEYDVWVENGCGNGFYHIAVFATSEEDAEKEAECYLLSGETILGIDKC